MTLCAQMHRGTANCTLGLAACVRFLHFRPNVCLFCQSQNLRCETWCQVRHVVHKLHVFSLIKDMLRSRAHVGCLFRPFEIDSVFGSLHYGMIHTAIHPECDSYSKCRFSPFCVGVCVVSCRCCTTIIATICLSCYRLRWLWRPLDSPVGSEAILSRCHFMSI